MVKELNGKTIKMVKHFTDDSKFALFDYEDGHGNDGNHEDNPYGRGDIVIKGTYFDGSPCNEIGVVLQVHDQSELRTDMFGNECTTRLRSATYDEIEKYRPDLIPEIISTSADKH